MTENTDTPTVGAHPGVTTGTGIGGDAFALNFGGGTGYAFLSPDEREGRFYWDCV